MENVISVTTHHDSHSTKIEIDNASDFKDFKIVHERKGKPAETVTIQMHKDQNNPLAKVSLEIGKIALFGREVELLKEFLNQI